MLGRLSVENYALIDKLDLELGGSLNIITGETGAGKSILLGALGLLLGNRCDSSALRDRERNCVVEGEFDIEAYGLADFFRDNELEYEPRTVIRRVISPSGKSRAYINDLPVQNSLLREFGTYLIDIHSQHQSLLLAEDGFRTKMLDTVASQGESVSEYARVYDSLRTAEKNLAVMREEAENRRKDEEWLRFQADQLTEAKLRHGEQEELEALQTELSHAEEIREALLATASSLGEDECGVNVMLKTSENILKHVEGFYPRAGDFAARVRTALVELRDIESELAAESGRMESDPSRLQTVSDRLDALYTLQQKHRAGSVDELITLKEEYERRLDSIIGDTHAIVELEGKIAELSEEALRLSAVITAGRRGAADKVSAYVGEMLGELGMPHGRLIVDVTPAGSLRATGADNIDFRFSANRDSEPAPIEKTASGGEISRVMLALKSLAAKTGGMPTLIFDEIDSGVSGRIADAMGEIIFGLSRERQVINITHLPQVACKGSSHYLVYKGDDGDSVHTRIELLDGERRVEEIAKMLSGSEVTSAAKSQARLLLGIDG